MESEVGLGVGEGEGGLEGEVLRGSEFHDSVQKSSASLLEVRVLLLAPLWVWEDFEPGCEVVEGVHRDEGEFVVNIAGLGSGDCESVGGGSWATEGDSGEVELLLVRRERPEDCEEGLAVFLPCDGVVANFSLEARSQVSYW